MLVDAGDFLARQIDDGRNVMFEGAQGTIIDIDHGNYPYVTSSNPTAGGACTGTGLGPTVVGDGDVIGIVKAYLTRVGSGPLPRNSAASSATHASYDEDTPRAATRNWPSTSGRRATSTAPSPAARGGSAGWTCR